MKKYIKKWLGITGLESIVGDEESVKKEKDFFYLWTFSAWNWRPTTLVEKVEQQKKDFEELDNKFDALEKYLQVEFFKKDEETQVYDWADKKHTEGFRKTKPYEVIKKSKEEKSHDDYDD